MSQPPNTMSSSDGEIDELANARRPSIGALTETNGAQFGQRSNGGRELLANGVHAGNDGRADGAQPDEQNAQFSVGGRDFHRRFHGSDYIKEVLHDTRVKTYDWVMLFRFRKMRAMDPLQVAMTGVRMGERYLQVFCSDDAHPGTGDQDRTERRGRAGRAG